MTCTSFRQNFMRICSNSSYQKKWILSTVLSRILREHCNKNSMFRNPAIMPLTFFRKNVIMLFMAIPHKERLATLHAICLQISLQSLFRIFSHASCVHIFRDISGKYSKIHKGFSPFFPSSLKKSDDAICIRQIRNRLSYFTKMLVNTSSIHSAFCFI